MYRRHILGALVASTLLAGSTPAVAQGADLVDQANQELGLLRSELTRVIVVGQSGEPVVATLDFDGSPLTMSLTPRSVRAAGFELREQRADGSVVTVDPGPVQTYRGEVLEQSGSTVAASLLDDGLYARIRFAEGEEYWLEPLAGRVAGAGVAQHALYRWDDVAATDHGCGSDLLPNNFPVHLSGGEGLPGVFAGIQVAELGCDADYEYFLEYGSSTAVGNRIEAVIGTMNAQYESEVGITHEIGTILVRTSSNQPYTSSDATTLLNQFRSEWNSNQGGVSRDTAHLFTGKEINGGTIGIAWVGVVCNSSYGYGLVQSDFNGNFSCATDLSAHELGHNWNAGHCNCTSYTMNPYITCANTFSPSLSRPDIVAYRDAIGCLDGGGGTGGPSVLFSDGFESGGFAAGGWSAENNDARVTGQASRSGSFGARLRSSTSIERGVDTSGFATVRLEYSRRTSGMDAGESLVIEWYDGSTWHTVESVSTTAWVDQGVDLGAAAGENPAFRIRFVTNCDRKNERGDVDDVRVLGS